MGRVVIGSNNSNARILTVSEPIVQIHSVITKEIEYIDRPIHTISEIEKIVEVPVEVEKLVYIKPDLTELEEEISDLSRDLAQNQLYNHEVLSRMEEVLNSQGSALVELRQQKDLMTEEQKKLLQKLVEQEIRQAKQQKVLYIVIGICFLINVLINFIK